MIEVGARDKDRARNVRLVDLDDYAIVERWSGRNELATYNGQIEGIMLYDPHRVHSQVEETIDTS